MLFNFYPIKLYCCPRVAIKFFHNYDDNIQLLGWGSNLSDYNSFQIMIFTLQHHTLSWWSPHFEEGFFFFSFKKKFPLFLFFVHSSLFVCICLFLNVVIFSKSLKVVWSQLFVCILQMFKLVQYSVFLKTIVDISNWSLITIVCL